MTAKPNIISAKATGVTMGAAETRSVLQTRRIAVN